MGIITTQSIKNSINLYIGIIIGAVNTILVFPFVFESNPEYWGLLQLLVSYSIVISSFSHLGGPSILLRYFPKIHDKGKLISFSLFLSLVGFLLFFFIFSVFKDYFLSELKLNLLLSDNFHFIAILVFSIIFFEIFNSLSKSFLDSTTPVFLNEVALRFYILVLLVCYHFKFFDFSFMLFAYVAGYFFQLLIILFLQLKHHRITFSFKWNINEIKSQIKYGTYVILGGGAAALVARLDMIMIEYFMDLKQVAYYGLAFFIASVIKTPSRSIAAISSPLLAKAFEQNNSTEIKDIYRKSSINLLIIGALLFLGIWLNIDEILSILPEKFQQGKQVIFYIGLAQIFNLMTGVNGLIIINSDFYKLDLYLNILLVILTIFINILLIPLYGIEGAAMATATSLFIYNFLKLLVVKVNINVQPFSFNTFKVIALACIVYFLVPIIPLDFSNDFFSIIIRSIIIVLLYSIPILYFNLSDDITQFVQNTYAKLRYNK
jgi:O-antigen/teichoic acid export membrane protein